jgi:hypothetical protein
MYAYIGYWIQLVLWLPLALGLLQPIKGAVITVQWHLGMHGFEYARKIRNSNACASQHIQGGDCYAS